MGLLACLECRTADGYVGAAAHHLLVLITPWNSVPLVTSLPVGRSHGATPRSVSREMAPRSQLGTQPHRSCVLRPHRYALRLCHRIPSVTDRRLSLRRGVPPPPGSRPRPHFTLYARCMIPSGSLFTLANVPAQLKRRNQYGLRRKARRPTLAHLPPGRRRWIYGPWENGVCLRRAHARPKKRSVIGPKRIYWEICIYRVVEQSVGHQALPHGAGLA